MRLNIPHLYSSLSGNDCDYFPTPITSAEIDSRDVQGGSVFCAFRGEQADGHQYIPNALQNGASVIIVETPMDGVETVDCRSGKTAEWSGKLPVQFWVDDTQTALQQWATAWRSQFDTRVVGITGSVGKTSSKELIHTVLSQSFNTLKSAGNRNNEIGLPLTLLTLESHHERAVLEMGMYVPGEITQLCAIASPDVGVLTLIDTVHLERIGSLDKLVAGKRELVEALDANGIAILNADDEYVIEMASHTSAKIITYGIENSADVTATDIVSDGFAGMQFTLHLGEQSAPVNLALMGRHSVYTALRASAVGWAEGMTIESIVAGLELHSIPMRMQQKTGVYNIQIIDDTYNASPRSTLAALDLLGSLVGRKVAILGDMLELGSDEEAGHRRVGRRASEVADLLICVGNRAKMIGDEAENNAHPLVFYFDNSAEASTQIADFIQAGDIVLIKGSRGIRMERITERLVEKTAEVEA